MMIVRDKNITVPTVSSVLSIHSVNEDVMPVEAIDLIELGCNYLRSNNTGFTINITKIYGSNTPPVPNWWFNSPGESPINDNGWEPCLGTYGWNGYYELTIVHEGSSNIGVNAPEIHSVQDIEAVRIPLVDSNGNETTYHLRFMFADELSPYFEDDIGLVLYNGDTVVKDWRLREYGTLNQVSHYYLCIGVDTMNCIDYSQGQDPVSKHNILYACIIMEGQDYSQACVGYYGNAIDLTQLSSRGLYLSSDWYTPSNS